MKCDIVVLYLKQYIICKKRSFCTGAKRRACKQSSELTTIYQLQKIIKKVRILIMAQSFSSSAKIRLTTTFKTQPNKFKINIVIRAQNFHHLQRSSNFKQRLGLINLITTFNLFQKSLLSTSFSRSRIITIIY